MGPFNGKLLKMFIHQCCCLLFIASIVMSKNFGLITPIGMYYIIHILKELNFFSGIRIFSVKKATAIKRGKNAYDLL